MNKSDNFENKAKEYLDSSINQLSPDITRRLQMARYAALEKAEKKSKTFWLSLPKALAAATAVAIISISLFMNVNFDNTAETVLAMESEMEILTSNENLELMEDLEFIQWLVETEKYAG